MNTPCFDTGTQVATSIDASGHLTTQNIQDVQVGDRVLTWNQNDPNAPIEQRPVTAVSVHTVPHLRLLISWHGDERCEERGVSPWQLAADIDAADLIDERPASLPNPSVRLRHTLADGSTVIAIWAWLSISRRAKLITVFFED